MTPDPRPGAYYVSVMDHGEPVGGCGLLSGPYGSHAAALGAMDECGRVAYRADARATWWAFGTARMEPTRDAPAGELQKAGLLSIPGGK